mmetsp:Transcript_3871/g.11450  ORF Transcript_3871/g.11450 Transcript_3871/m.11450 type:complete len:311 (-) Transcript_3871:455-1387(-)
MSDPTCRSTCTCSLGRTPTPEHRSRIAAYAVLRGGFGPPLGRRLGARIDDGDSVGAGAVSFVHDARASPRLALGGRRRGQRGRGHEDRDVVQGERHEPVVEQVEEVGRAERAERGAGERALPRAGRGRCRRQQSGGAAACARNGSCALRERTGRRAAPEGRRDVNAPQRWCHERGGDAVNVEAVEVLLCRTQPLHEPALAREHGRRDFCGARGLCAFRERAGRRADPKGCGDVATPQHGRRERSGDAVDFEVVDAVAACASGEERYNGPRAQRAARARARDGDARDARLERRVGGRHEPRTRLCAYQPLS